MFLATASCLRLDPLVEAGGFLVRCDNFLVVAFPEKVCQLEYVFPRRLEEKSKMKATPNSYT